MQVADRTGIMEGRPAPRVLAVASSGGHWVQLMRLRPAWQGCDVAYLTTDASYLALLRAQAERDGVPPPRFYTTVAANRWQKLRLLHQLASIAWVVMKERPTVVCTTGAAPGYFAIRIAGLLGARTVWIDSIANAESLSMAGMLAGRCADVWLTQWESLAADGAGNGAGGAGGADDGRRPASWGAVL